MIRITAPDFGVDVDELIRLRDAAPAEGAPPPRPEPTEMPGVRPEVLSALANLYDASSNAVQATCPIDPGVSVLDFVERYSLKIEGKPFALRTNYSHLIDLYEDDHRGQVIMAGAQTGKSAFLMAMLARMAIVDWGSMFGYYFPDFHLPKAFSSKRFAPFLASSPVLRPFLGATRTDGTDGSNNVLTRTFGPSTWFFLSVKGKTATEGLPMKGVAFDEVRRMMAGDVQRAEERTSAQTNPWNIKVSTANYPEEDIHGYFLKGDQRHFHTECRCTDGVVLSHCWPDCVIDMRDASPELRRKVDHVFTMACVDNYGVAPEDAGRYPDAVYVCPKCGDIIVDPRRGFWREHKLGRWTHSWQLPQMLSHTYPAGRVWKEFTDPNGGVLDIQEFYNSKLGLPYIDKETRGATIEDCLTCVDNESVWSQKMGREWRRANMKNTALGADCQAGYHCVVIKTRTASGKYRTVHVEVCDDPTEGFDPWRRVAQLMLEYDVKVAVIDGAPHWNEAKRFQQAFPGRVWLASYHDEQSSKGRSALIRWSDRKGTGQRGDEVLDKGRVSINRTLGLRWSLRRWRNRLNVIGNPDTLIQELPIQAGKVVFASGLRGRRSPVAIVRAVYLDHQTRVAFRKEYADEDAKRTGSWKFKAEHIGIDPHFAHAELYCNAAMSRIMGREPEDVDDD